VSRIHTKEIEEGYSIPPAQKEKSARQYQNHRENIQHEIYVDITRRIFCVWDKHFTMILREIPHPISVEAHNNYRNVFAEPSKKFQNPSAIPISVFHQ